jgi:hypothetical protein
MASPRTTNPTENPEAGSQAGKSDASANLRAMRAANINPKRPGEYSWILFFPLFIIDNLIH